MDTRVLAALLLSLLPATSTATAASETTWMAVLLDGRKIGHLESVRAIDGARVTTTDTMRLVIDRAGLSIALRTEERAVETRDGVPLAFSARTEMSGVASTVEGTLGKDGKASVVIRTGGSEERREIDWPKGALLPEGMRLAERRHGLATGTRYRLLAFQPSDLSAIEVEVEVAGPEPVDLFGRRATLTRVDQRLKLPGAPVAMRSWVDPDQALRKSVLPLMGLELELVACARECAEAPNQPADILEHTMVAAPRPLPDGERRAGLGYRLELAGDGDATLPSVAEQTARRERGAWRVEVDPTPSAADATAPTPGDREPTRWLQSTHPRIVEAARGAVGEARDAVSRMALLERFVREHIANKSMRIGYASALETLSAREGDCTEHAVLLAALGRALGIPTRVANGLAYAPRFAGREHVFVPHAWVQAFVGGEWRSYDAALAGFDGGHIALSTGDGDAAGFYAGVSLLGRVRIVDAEPLAAP